MRNLIIFGISETAERVYEFVSRYNLFNIIGFTVDSKFKTTEVFCGKPVWNLEVLDNFINKEEDLLFVAIFWNRLNKDRRCVYENLKSKGYHFANIISPLASVRSQHLGDNCWIMDNVIIQEKVLIGNNVFIADGALIGHLACVKSHCFVALRSIICGSVILGEQCFVGVNATIFDDTIIGEKCIIGACTIIKRNVESYTVCKTANDGLVEKLYDNETIETKWMANHNIR